MYVQMTNLFPLNGFGTTVLESINFKHVIWYLDIQFYFIDLFAYPYVSFSLLIL